MLKACSRCGKIHGKNECKVPKFRDYKTYGKEDEYRRFRTSKHWRKKREEILKRDGHKCVLCWDNKHICTHGLHVHHIVPLAEDMTRRLDDSNLITLCGDCHRMVHSGYNPSGEPWENVLKKLI